MARKKKHKYGFHYTWKDITPKSKIVTVKATDLEDARTQARAAAKKLKASSTPGCHWITMPQDYDRIVTKARLQAKKDFLRKHSRIIISLLLLGLFVIFLSACSLESCNTSLSRFNKKLTNWTSERYGITTYKLEPIPRETPYRLPPPEKTKPVESGEETWESPVFFHP